jgi:hypothetical protein
MPAGYHNGSTKQPHNGEDGRIRISKVPVMERRVIAWDMEGMSLSGPDKPQHPVLFGCSARVDRPLIGERLSSLSMLHHVIHVGRANPTAIHIGYVFKYDANMMLQDLPFHCIVRLWKRNRTRFIEPRAVDDNGRAMDEHGWWYWTVQYIPGKKLTITRSDSPRNSKGRKGVGYKGSADRTTVTIYDYSAFFGGASFLSVAESILRDELSDDDRETIARGKAERGTNTYADLPRVLHYWRREIVLIERVFRRFRDVMDRAGFQLSEWYGPGALANAINRTRGIRSHLAGGQSTSGLGVMPLEVHEASKVAFSGGRFEPFQLGRTTGPIHCVDINSAYPYALTMVPSLSPEHGQWVHDDRPTKIQRFGIYRITYRAPRGSAVEFRPMPLFWRDARGMISYPALVSGWYMSPEARLVISMPGVTVHEGWVWESDKAVFPWEFLHDMYATRQRLGKDNLLSLPFKLGPNSLYGKYAQTVGWNETKRTPPKSHCLPVAAWVTSYCRAMLWNAMSRAPDRIVAVETDSIFTTATPDELGVTIGPGLGQWSHKVIDEIVYLQSGVYLSKSGDTWNGVRSRGVTRSEFPTDDVLAYLQTLEPGQSWPAFTLTTKPRFVGMGAALQLSRKNGEAFKRHHCTWQVQHKDITFGDRGKRRHHAPFCRACSDGLSPWDGPHRTFVASPSDGECMSHPRRLPWEQKHTDEVQEIRDQIVLERELIA